MKAVSGKQFCRALERHGWRLLRIHDSHHIYQKPGSIIISVQVHGNKTLKIGMRHGS